MANMAPVDERDGIEEGMESQRLAVMEERLSVSKRLVRTGAVRVSTRTETREELAELEVSRNKVDVTRVPVDRIVDGPLQVRTEGNTTIVPVVEERLVVVKQYVLKEELHIRYEVEQDVVREPVTLRRQQAVVERLDADGRLVPEHD